MVRAAFALVGCLALAAVGTAHDDPARAELDKAKATYDGKLEKFRKDVLAKLDDREAAARKKGDNKLIDRLAEEKEAFEKDNIVPASLAPLGFQKQQNQLRAMLEAAYKAVAKKYSAGKQDAEAKAVQQELEQFQEAFDALKPGTVWGGDHTQRFAGTNKGGTQGVKLTITKRKGNSFGGEVAVQNGTKFTVEGSVEQGVLKFKDTEKGHKYEGTVSGRVLVARFEGFSLALNTATAGTWKLELTR